MQFKCKTSAKSVTSVQITHRNSICRLSLTERQKQFKFSKTMIMSNDDEKFVQNDEASNDKKWLQELSSGTSSVGN